MPARRDGEALLACTGKGVVAMQTYVMQVATGREQKTLALVERMLGKDARTRFFAPRYRYHKKIHGSWETVEELLTPGYVYFDAPARAVGDLAQQIKQAPAFARVLTQDGKIVPLSAAECDWLVRLTGPTHVVEPSIGVIEGDRVTITDGPLVGMESQIKKIDRHKRLAYLDVHLLGRTKTVKVGVEIVKKTGEGSNIGTGAERVGSTTE